jgi:hypothetical protein
MEKQSEIMTQYGKIHTLYKTIVYLQKEIKKETDKLKKLEEKEEKHG